jgi:hypothetical protein
MFKPLYVTDYYLKAWMYVKIIENSLTGRSHSSKALRVFLREYAFS